MNELAGFDPDEEIDLYEVWFFIIFQQELCNMFHCASYGSDFFLYLVECFNRYTCQCSKLLFLFFSLTVSFT